MSIASLLRVTASEAGRGGLDFWRQAVSKALDSGVATPQFGQAKKGAALAVIGVDTTLPIELSGLIRGLTYQASGNWILTPGKTYLLRGEGYFTGFSDAVNGYLDIAWVDDYNARLVAESIDSPTGHFMPTTSTDANSSSSSVSMIYRVPTSDPRLSVARLRCLSASGTGQMPTSSWTSTVIEIPG